MAFGVLEDRKLGQNVPGTALLSGGLQRSKGVENIKLKHAPGHENIVLVPQPSNDGKDPLNWPRWKKETHFLSGSIGHLLNAGFADIATEWGVSVNSVAATNADLAMALGWFTLIQGSLAIKVGRRPVFLFASACQFFTCIWAAKSENINSFKAARVFQGLHLKLAASIYAYYFVIGFGMAPYEALVTASIGDVYFVHERGTRVAIWNFAIGGGIAITPIINGFIINRPELGWRWTFWIIMIAFGISLLTSIFFMPETMYDRQPAYNANFETTYEDFATSNSDVPGLEDEGTVSAGVVQKGSAEQIKLSISASRDTSLSPFSSPPKTFTEELKPWSYTSNVGFVKALLRPFPFLLSPAVWFTFLAYGCTTVWLVVVSVIYSLVFGSAPYFFDATKVGLVSIGPFIGSVLGTVVAGPLSDWSVKWAAKRNNGIYEPEFRLFLLVPMFILDIAGYIGWAIMQPKGVPWIGPVVMYSMISAGQCIGSTAVCSYLIDVHRKNTPECFALINFMKNMVLYGFTLAVNGWVVELGVLRTFGMLAAVTAFCILAGIPMYIFGKRARSFVARHPKLFLTD
ncbi:MFS general substrate transporter [Phellopilus nigrolimitatus]|nr:MFS general substrate transporter [Phellopilus nigrolimitatus]